MRVQGAASLEQLAAARVVAAVNLEDRHPALCVRHAVNFLRARARSMRRLAQLCGQRPDEKCRQIYLQVMPKAIVHARLDVLLAFVPSRVRVKSARQREHAHAPRIPAERRHLAQRAIQGTAAGTGDKMRMRMRRLAHLHRYSPFSFGSGCPDCWIAASHAACSADRPPE